MLIIHETRFPINWFNLLSSMQKFHKTFLFIIFWGFIFLRKVLRFSFTFFRFYLSVNVSFCLLNQSYKFLEIQLFKLIFNKLEWFTSSFKIVYHLKKGPCFRPLSRWIYFWFTIQVEIRNQRICRFVNSL